ncbi:hypothetical protein HPP92_005161 [Vanilla planifolia]|uniref:Transmembrane protein n=1 Tax=Vanilla planifolia TaxID=51239 RepID=A0A835RTB8_VANPL|nr:hypothetical protein HPP92_005161 [Vanilla planifolia]
MQRTHRSILEIDFLPTTDPCSFAGKKEARRLRFAEWTIHALPIVTFLCIIVLCFLSSRDIDGAARDAAIVSRVNNDTVAVNDCWECFMFL